MRSRKYRKWTQEEDDYLKQKYTGLNAKLLIRKLGRTKLSIQKRASILGITDKRNHISENSIKALQNERNLKYFLQTSQIKQFVLQTEYRKVDIGLWNGLIIMRYERLATILGDYGIDYKINEQKFTKT